MWSPTEKHTTPRTDRRLPKLSERGSTINRRSGDRPVLPPAALSGSKPFFVEDDKRSKITVISLKSDRTSKTVQTEQSALSPRARYKPPPKGAKAILIKAKTKVKDGFRQSSIKRIIASGLCLATTILYSFGVFLPFWNVYTYSVSGVTTGYYGGLWTYCERVTGGDTTCMMYTESNVEHWFRLVRVFELMAFLGMVGLMTLVVAYMFFLREIKYIYIQWIIIVLCFGIALFALLGLIIYGVYYADSSHLSSAYGLTSCAFLGSCASGALFLWDKLVMTSEAEAERRNATMKFRGVSRSTKLRSRLSHVRSTRSHAAPSQRSQLSNDKTTAICQASSVPRSTRFGATTSTVSHLPPTNEV